MLESQLMLEKKSWNPFFWKHKDIKNFYKVY